MEQAALTFLEHHVARRLAVSWPCAHRGSANRRRERWIAAAAIEEHEEETADRFMHALRVHEICREDGTTDLAALAYIRALLAKTLPRGIKP